MNKIALQISVERIDSSENSPKVIGYPNGKNIKIDSDRSFFYKTSGFLTESASIVQ